MCFQFWTFPWLKNRNKVTNEILLSFKSREYDKIIIEKKKKKIGEDKDKIAVEKRRGKKENKKKEKESEEE